MAYWMIRTAWDEDICDYTEVKRGDPTEDEGDAFCSECGGDALEDHEESYVWSRFCPHCGAEMENWQTDEQREVAYAKWWEDYHKREAEREAKMTPEERALRDWVEAHGPQGGTGAYWREDYV